MHEVFLIAGIRSTRVIDVITHSPQLIRRMYMNLLFHPTPSITNLSMLCILQGVIDRHLFTELVKTWSSDRILRHVRIVR